MNKFETMAIPIEADGIVDDQQAFEEMQNENEAQLLKEIEGAIENDELHMDYEDMELAENTGKNNGKELKIAKRKRVFGHKGLGIFAKIAS